MTLRPNWHQEFEQGTVEWETYKIGRIGCSSLDVVLAHGVGGGESVGRAKLIHRLANEREFGVSLAKGYESQAIRDGKEREPLARVCYEGRMGILVEQFGFIDHPSIPWFGSSPDGVEDAPIRLLGQEFKCPELHTHNETLLTKKLIRKYFLQCHGLCECGALEAVDYVSFQPYYPENDPRRLFIKRIYRDEKTIKEIKSGVIRLNEEIEELRLKLRSIGDPVYLEKV